MGSSSTSEVTTRPLAKYENGQLFLDRGFADYCPYERFFVWMKGAEMEGLADHLEANGRSADYARQKQAECLEALRAHDMEKEREE